MFDVNRCWGMHLTPEPPRSSIWAVEGYSRTLEAFLERFAFRFRFNRHCLAATGEDTRRTTGFEEGHPCQIACKVLRQIIRKMTQGANPE